jgi:hypothetical protein
MWGQSRGEDGLEIRQAVIKEDFDVVFVKQGEHLEDSLNS